MLRTTMPELTLEGVKAFAKTLRKRDATNIEDLAGHLLSDLLTHQSEVTILTADGLSLGLPSVSWVLGTTGSGKSELVLTIAALAMKHPKRKVVIISREAARIAPLLGTDGSGLDHKIITLPDEYANPEATVQQILPHLESLQPLQDQRLLIVIDGLSRWGLSVDTPILHRAEQLFEALRAAPNVNVVIATQDRLMPLFQQHYRGSLDAVVNVSHGPHPKTATITYQNQKTIRFAVAPMLATQDDRIDLIRGYVRSSLVMYEDFIRHLQERLPSSLKLSSHIQALEETAHLLGFSSWHSLQGHLGKSERKPTKTVAPTPRTELIRKIIDGIEGSGSDSMWMDRSITLLKALEHSGLDITSKTFIDDMLGSDHPEVLIYLSNLAGYPSNRSKFMESFSYDMMPILHALRNK